MDNFANMSITHATFAMISPWIQGRPHLFASHAHCMTRARRVRYSAARVLCGTWRCWGVSHGKYRAEFVTKPPGFFAAREALRGAGKPSWKNLTKIGMKGAYRSAYFDIFWLTFPTLPESTGNFFRRDPEGPIGGDKHVFDGLRPQYSQRRFTTKCRAIRTSPGTFIA